jgi:uncharacterized membrane protein SpoIIM required for sporulation
MAGLTEFIERRKPGWDRLNGIVHRAGSSGVRSLPRDDLKALGPLYRRAASDLAFARLRGGDAALIHYLNDLVTRAHGLLYAERGPGSARLWRFISAGFPRLLHRRRIYILLAVAFFGAGGVAGAVLTAHDPDNGRIFLGPRAEETNFYRDLPKTLKDEDRPEDAAGLMTHNTSVAVLAFAVGILGGFPTLILLFNNGLPIGALAVLQHRAGLDRVFWSFIAPHGVPELSAIFIAAGAGMIIGHALIAPGELSRRDALMVAGRDAVRMLLGTTMLFIVAGFTESFVSPTALPAAYKFAYAGLMAVALTAYVRRGDPTPRPPLPGGEGEIRNGRLLS